MLCPTPHLVHSRSPADSECSCNKDSGPLVCHALCIIFTFLAWAPSFLDPLSEASLLRSSSGACAHRGGGETLQEPFPFSGWLPGLFHSKPDPEPSFLTPESIRQPEPFVRGSLNSETTHRSVLILLMWVGCALPQGKTEQRELAFLPV